MPSWGFAEEALAPPPEVEAPEALFDQKIGDVGVVLEADGTWTTRLAGGWGQGQSSRGSFPGLGYPGYEKGGVFTQRPDFSLTLRLLERYYLEVVYGGSLEDRFFLVGYQGKEGELLQWAKAGNDSFSVPHRAGQVVAEGRAGAPAAAAAFTLGPVSLEVLGRYEDGTRETRSFQGFRETSTARVTLDQWIRGRFFRLPASMAPFTGVRVLVEDPDGTLGLPGHRLREAQDSEFTMDLRTGTISLAFSATKRYLVTWSGASSWDKAPTPRLGLTAVEDTEPAGGPWFVLAQPGLPSPFEERNRYPLPPETMGPVVLVGEDQHPVPGYSVGQAIGRPWFEVSGEAEAPFFDAFPGLYPAAEARVATPPSPATVPWFFLLPGTTGTGYSLGTGILASSLVVVRNGIPTTAYRFDPATGSLRFDTPIFDSDLIQVSFQREDSQEKASDLVLWHGGRWEVRPGQSWEWALQGRWNMEKDAYTSEDLESPGTMVAAVAGAGTSGNWTWKGQVTGGALLTDSTGHRRLYGFAGEGTKTLWDGDSLRPAAAPEALAGLSLTETNRAPLSFRNHWTNDPLTGKPEVSAWGKAGIDREPSGTDGWVGPYLVRGDGIRTDRLAVLEGDPAPGEWFGLQGYVNKGKPLNLSTSTALSVTLRVPNGLGTARVFLQAGSLSNNWDGTGAVKALEYRRFPALMVYDQARARRQFFPIPEGTGWGNDPRSDGVAGRDGVLLTREILLAPADGGWQTMRFLLTDQERQGLHDTTGWRLVLVQGNEAVTRSVLVGPVVFEGNSWTVAPSVAAPPGSSVNPVEQSDPSDHAKRQLRIDWTGRDLWSIEGRNPPVRPTSYRTLVFRYRLVQANDPTMLKLTLSDSDGRGVEVSWQPKANDRWVEARVNLREKSLELDGQRAGTVKMKSGAAVWDRLTVEKTGTSTEGTLLVADIEAQDPQWEPVASSLLSASWKQTSAWPSPQWPWISGITWSGTSSHSGLTSDDALWKGMTNATATMGPLRASAEATLSRAAEKWESQTSYEATLPLVGPWGSRLEWTDRFSDVGSRAERVILGIPWIGTLEANAAVKGQAGNLDQDYSLGWKSPATEGGGAGVQAQWSQTRPRVTPLGSWGQTWKQSWGWLLPPEETAPFYLLQAKADARTAGTPWSFDLKAQNQASQSLGSERNWSAWGQWESKIQWRPTAEWSLSPSVTKSMQAILGGTTTRAVGPSAWEALRRLWSPRGGLASIPFGEQGPLGVPWNPDEEDFRSGQVQSTAGLDWDRSLTSTWTDLTVPSAAGVKVTGVRGQQGAAAFQSQTVTGRVQARALNLFGALGSNPVFPWYRTDSWSWNTAGSWGTGTRVQDRMADAALTLRSDLILSEAESLGLPVSYQGKWGSSTSHSVKTDPAWSFRGPANLPIELPRWLSPSSFRKQWVQDLGVSLDIGWQPTPSPLVRDLQVTWKGRLLLSEKSEMNLTTRWGQQWQNDLTVLGLEAALEVILAF